MLTYEDKCGIICDIDLDFWGINMLANERQDIIKKLLEQNGAVKTSNLVEKFNVSLETVRRDFIAMEEEGLLKKVHGGAIAISDMKPYFSLEQRYEEFFQEKMELAQFACEFINEGDIIGIDTGATCTVFAKVLKENFKRLTVITYSLDVFNILSKHADFSVILCGGNFDKSENCFYGSLVLEMLSKLHIQKVFLCPSAVSLEFGIGDYAEHLMLLQKKFIKISNEVYFLADSSKFEKKALLKLDDLKNEYTFITDSGFSKDVKDLYIENNINIINGEI